MSEHRKGGGWIAFAGIVLIVTLNLLVLHALIRYYYDEAPDEQPVTV